MSGQQDGIGVRPCQVLAGSEPMSPPTAGGTPFSLLCPGGGQHLSGFWMLSWVWSRNLLVYAQC